MDLDLQNVTWDPVLLSLAAFLAVCAIYLLFLRNAVMWGFLCILGIVVARHRHGLARPAEPLAQPAARLRQVPQRPHRVVAAVLGDEQVVVEVPRDHVRADALVGERGGEAPP